MAAFSQMVGIGENDSILYAPMSQVRLLGNVSYFAYQSAEMKGECPKLREDLKKDVSANADKYKTTIETLKQYKTLCNDIYVLLGSKCQPSGIQTPNFMFIINHLDRILKSVGFLTGFSIEDKKVQTAEEPVQDNNASSPAEPQTAAVQTVAVQTAGVVNNSQSFELLSKNSEVTREQVFEELANIAKYFRSTEPHSPVSYLIEKAIRWGHLSLPELLNELISDQADTKNRIFTIAGLMMEVPESGGISFLEELQETFFISPWLLLVPVLTGEMIARRWPAMVVLFMAALMAAIVAVVWQPALVAQVSGKATSGLMASYEGVMKVIYAPTHLQTGTPMLDELVHTSGMAGMMPTVWLIICAQVFGGVVTATGVLRDLMSMVLRFVRGTASLVASTVVTGLFCNIALADQFLSIILTSSVFKDIYRDRGYESRLLSRTCEDGATVTSVLVPWNTCGLVQSTVLGVATLTYLPYCFFNLLSPITSIVFAATGRGIYHKDIQNHHPISEEEDDGE